MSSDPTQHNPPPGSVPAADELTRESPVTPARVGDSPNRAGSLLEHIIADTAGPKPKRIEESTSLNVFLQSRTCGAALKSWFGDDVTIDGDMISIGNRVTMTRDQLVRRLNRDVATIDRKLNEQLNAVLHHPALQKLEASWRGIDYLTKRVDEASDEAIKVKMLNVTWRELERDFERAVEFDQSQLFKKVYEHEFGMPGGEPFGTLIADFDVRHQPNAEHPHDDMAILKELARVGAAAFCPILLNASPAMFGLDSFQELEHTVQHEKTLSQKVYTRWQSLRSIEESRFLGVVLPRVLMRLPYEDDGTRIDRFQFREDVLAADGSKYLWGSATYAMGEVLVRAFSQAGWLADIRGVQRGSEQGGIVSHLPAHSFSTDKSGIVPKTSTDIIVTDTLEKQLADLGFISLCHCKDTELSAFYSCNSIQKPKTYDRDAATMNAKISSMLQYMYCVSRFAHYVKVLGREKTGSFTDPQEFEDFFRRWIVQYVTSDTEATADTKAKFPLRQAEIKVQSVPGKPGTFSCVMHLAPHYELDELAASVRLFAEIRPGTVV